MEFRSQRKLRRRKLKDRKFTFCAIMPSKYTDEIENSSYTWRVFLCLENQNIV